jgi:hypothetical protein
VKKAARKAEKEDRERGPRERGPQERGPRERGPQERGQRDGRKSASGRVRRKRTILVRKQAVKRDV